MDNIVEQSYKDKYTPNHKPDFNKNSQVLAEDRDEIKYDKQKEVSTKQIDSETLLQLMRTGDNTYGMFTPDVNSEFKDGDKQFEDISDSAKIKTSGNAKVVGKYKKAEQEDMLKHPEDYYINTPRGRMTIAEAVKKGYDPTTRRFKSKESDKLKQEKEALTPEDKAGLDKIFAKKEEKPFPSKQVAPTKPAPEEEPINPDEAKPTEEVEPAQPSKQTPDQAGILSMLGGK